MKTGYGTLSTRATSCATRSASRLSNWLRSETSLTVAHTSARPAFGRNGASATSTGNSVPFLRRATRSRPPLPMGRATGDAAYRSRSATCPGAKRSGISASAGSPASSPRP